MSSTYNPRGTLTEKLLAAPLLDLARRLHQEEQIQRLVMIYQLQRHLWQNYNLSAERIIEIIR